MTDFRDKLLKAGLVTTEQAAQAERTDAQGNRGQRGKGRGGQHRDQGGRPGGPKGVPGAPDAREKAALEREARRVGRSSETRRSEADEARQVAKKGRMSWPQRGGIRWYFEGRAGDLPWVEIPGTVGEQLSDGRAAIVEDPGGQSWLVDGATAERLRTLDGAWVRVWNPTKAH